MYIHMQRTYVSVSKGLSVPPLMMLHILLSDRRRFDKTFTQDPKNPASTFHRNIGIYLRNHT